MRKWLDKFFLPDAEDSAEGHKDKSDSRRISKLIPNMVTLGSVAAGLTAIQKAVNEQWETAVLLILVATILDTLDGAVARLLNASSKFGAELDSLSDFLSFGVAPAMIMFLWVLQDAGKVGWIAVLIYVIASALRLARYNVSIGTKEDKPEWARNFFAGVPAPAASGLMLAPMIVAFLINEDMSDFSVATPLLALWSIVIAGLMVSSIPTFSSKQISLPTRSSMPILALVGLIIALLISAPWLSLTIFLGIYTLSIPIAIRVYMRREARATQTTENQNQSK
jgi:CDP-diacylglycerol--serine O-phosphatidyltransferase